MGLKSRESLTIVNMLSMANSSGEIIRAQGSGMPAESEGRRSSLLSSASEGRKRGSICVVHEEMANVKGALSPRRLDPRVSLAVLVLINATAFAPRLVVGQIAMVALCAAVTVWCGRVASAAKWCAAYVVVMAAGYAFLLFPNSVAASFATMIVMVRCVFCVGMFASTMIATTRAGELACALQRAHLPRHGIIAVCTALRFFPTMAGEFRAVAEALRVRGMAITPKSVVTQPVRTMENLLVPVMSRLSIVADELSNAAIVRGMDSARPRTSYYDLRLRAADIVFLGLFATAATALLLSKLGVIA